ncbi:hypothetical protein MPER_10654 [Moniliophthora perniciosa FA553]|nr:hypothetical protein MPER_10654 [Moniliophthora perniciosa FA553]
MPNHNNPATEKSNSSGAHPEAYSTMEPYYSEYSRMLRIPGEKEDNINVKNMKWAESHMAKLTLAPGAVQDATVQMDVVSDVDQRKSQHLTAVDVDGDVEMLLPEEVELSSRRKRKASHESGDPDIEVNAPPCKK